jgi:hypothetical protein
VFLFFWLLIFYTSSKSLNQISLFTLSLNFIGAALACLASVLIHYTPFIILEALWALVSLISIFKLMLKPQ